MNRQALNPVTRPNWDVLSPPPDHAPGRNARAAGESLPGDIVAVPPVLTRSARPTSARLAGNALHMRGGRHA